MGTLRTACAVAAAAAAAWFVPAARAAVDAEVPINFKARGTLAVPGQQDEYRVLAERGTVFTLTAAAPRKPGVQLTVDLLDTKGASAVLEGGTFTPPGTKVAFKAFRFATTGTYRIVVGADGIGDYALSLKGTPQAAWKGTVANLVTNAPFQFAAYPGATVSAVVRPSKGSAAAPSFLVLCDTSEAYCVDVSALGKKTATSHAVTVAGVRPGGNELVLELQDGGAAGDVEVSVKIRSPKVKPGRLDLRGVVLGRTLGSGTFKARPVDAGGGAVAVDDSSSDILGAGVSIPPGALASSTTIGVGSTVVPPLGSAADQAAGPAVDFEPSGLTFPSPVTITIPYDFSQVPADATPGDIRVRIVEKDGSAREVAPDAVDQVAGTVSIQSSGFSVCVPVCPRGLPRVGVRPGVGLPAGGDEYWIMVLGAWVNPDGSGDSRSRGMFVNMGAISLFTNGTVDSSSSEVGYSWGNLSSGSLVSNAFNSSATFYGQPDSGTLSWTYGADNRSIEIATPGLIRFRLSQDGNYMAGRFEEPTRTTTDTQFLVRKNRVPLTVASVNGTWTGMALEFDINGGPSGSTVPEPQRAIGTFTFDGAGGCRIAITQRDGKFNQSDSTYSQVASSGSFPATYAIDGDGSILVSLQNGDNTVLRFLPGPNLDVLLGSQDPAVAQSPLAILAMRESSNLGNSSLNGLYHGTEFETDVVVNQLGTAQGNFSVGDFTTESGYETITFDGGATAPVTFNDHCVRRDTGQANGVKIEEKPQAFTVNVTVTKSGKLTLGTADGSVTGWVSPDAQCLVFLSSPSSSTTDWEFGFALKAPPGN